MTKKTDKPTGAEALKAMEERLHGVVDALTGALGSAIEGRDQEHTQEFGEEGSPFRGVVHSRVRTGSVSDHVRGRSTPSKPAEAKTPAKAAPREIEPEVSVEGSTLYFSCEVPGVEASDVQIDITDGAIELHTSGQRAYHARVAIDETLASEPKSITLNNGILEAIFEVVQEGSTHE
ncbi:MAG: hypothetical protein HRU11_03020 [Parvularculaceae bacterium]|nr:hypothetical protein [Parvularculaceae bacterium]